MFALNCAQAITSFKPQEDNTWLREAVDDPDEVFKKVVLFPLLECEPLHHKVSTVQHSAVQNSTPLPPLGADPGSGRVGPGADQHPERGHW